MSIAIGNITGLTVRDRDSDETQTILTIANHPLFVQTASIPELQLVAGGSGPVSGSLRTGACREAGNLLQGDRLINADGSESVVQLAIVEDEAQDAYNLEVDGYHTFFVASHDNDNAPAVWVHNACPKWWRAASDVQEQMVLEAAKNGAGKPVLTNLGDPRFKGMEKWEYSEHSQGGRVTTVHYVRDPVTGRTMDFKIRSTLDMGKQQ